MFTALAMMVTCSCTTAPPWYPPPFQRAHTIGAEPRLLEEMISMNSPYADRYIVSGVLGGNPSDSWRWANQRAELRFQLLESKRQKMFVRFVIADETFKTTGPVTMRFFLEKHLLGAMRCDSAGERLFETPVAPSIIKVGEPLIIAVEADKVWTSTDNTKLGFLLVSAGFKE